MNELFLMAEEEMKDLKHPYVGTEHFLLAFFKKYNSFYLNYEDFKDYVIKVIGKSNICSEYILYTPILRRIKNDCQNVYECMIKILTDDDSIAYSLLLSLGVDIEAFYLSIVKNEIELI